jgi:hypothetical protein
MEVIILVGLYFVPAILAKKLRLKDASSICYVNLLFGWTAIGWILALTWTIGDWIETRRPKKEAAFKGDEQTVADDDRFPSANHFKKEAL